MTVFEEIRKRAKSQFDIDIENRPDRNLDDSSVQEKATPLLPAVGEKMGVEFAQLEASIKRIGLSRNLHLAGHTWSEDGGSTYVIELSEGLLLFHYKLVACFVSRMTVVGDEGEVLEETKISNDRMLSAFYGLLRDFWKGPNAFLVSPGFSMFDLTKPQLELAAFLLHHADTFVVAHEFGHVLLETARERVARDLMILEGARDSMVRPVLEEITGSADPAILEDWMNEIAADFLGLDLCLGLAENEIQKMTIHASAMLALVMSDMLEKYYRHKVGKNWRYETHPPSDLRLAVLQTASDWGAPGQELGESFRKFGDFVLSRLFEGGVEEPEPGAPIGEAEEPGLPKEAVKAIERAKTQIAKNRFTAAKRTIEALPDDPLHLRVLKGNLLEQVEEARAANRVRKKIDRAVKRSQELVGELRFKDARKVISRLPSEPKELVELKNNLTSQVDRAEKHYRQIEKEQKKQLKKIERTVEKVKSRVAADDFDEARRLVRSLPEEPDQLKELKASLAGQVDQAQAFDNAHKQLERTVEEVKKLVGAGRFGDARRAVEALPSCPSQIKEVKQSLLGQIDEAAKAAEPPSQEELRSIIARLTDKGVDLTKLPDLAQANGVNLSDMDQFGIFLRTLEKQL